MKNIYTDRVSINIHEVKQAIYDDLKRLFEDALNDEGDNDDTYVKISIRVHELLELNNKLGLLDQQLNRSKNLIQR